MSSVNGIKWKPFTKELKHYLLKSYNVSSLIMLHQKHKKTYSLSSTQFLTWGDNKSRVLGKRMHSAAKLPQVQSWPSNLPSGWAGASYPTSLCLDNLSCLQGIISPPQELWGLHERHFEQCQVHSKASVHFSNYHIVHSFVSVMRIWSQRNT